MDNVKNQEWAEKELLDRINKLYYKVRGKMIRSELTYSGCFLNILKETYKLPNDRIVKKEKVIKNNGKRSVIIVAIDMNNNYIITMQNRINDTMIAEFPSGYIEENESIIGAAKRELREETGYSTDELYVFDWAFSSPGIDNSITFLVVANNCVKNAKVISDCNEFVKYDLFSESELGYLIDNNIMSGALNKLAYYKYINVTDKHNKTIIKNNNLFN